METLRAPWRDVPPKYGSWNTIYRRFRRWNEAGAPAESPGCTPAVGVAASVTIDGVASAPVTSNGSGVATVDAPAGSPVTDSVTPCGLPEVTAVVTVKSVDIPAITVADGGSRLTEKSFCGGEVTRAIVVEQRQ